MKNTKKPFGLTIASNIAAKAIHDGIAPVSTILCNMFFLQKNETFPKELDTHFFSVNKYSPNELEKKSITMLLDTFKKPQANTAQIMENFFEQGWQKKIQPKPAVQPKIEPPKPKTWPKRIKSKAPEPTIVIKKNKLV